jgi:hypothetical protein
MKTKADLQMRLAEIKIRGYIKDWDEFMLLYMILTDQIDMPRGALYEGGTNNGETVYKRGLFNPLRTISTASANQKDRLKKFAQHFPMLFKNGQSPDNLIRTLGDLLYNTSSAKPEDWMQLLNRDATGYPLRVNV